MHEKIYPGKNYEVIYKFEPASSDRRTLLVIFSGGFGTKKHYDFDGPSSKAIKCNILWIRDTFEDNFTYYIRNNKGFGVAEDVQDLICHYISVLKNSKNDVILAGFSKGGTAALYHGLRYGYRNIISTVPRIRIGSANINRRPSVYRYMIGESSPKNTALLDSILPELLTNDNQLDRNLYLFSSEADRQYKSEILPVLPLFRRYANFNFVLTSSRLVRRHHEVTRYNIPLIISIINSLVDKVVPCFGEIKNGSADVEKQVHPNSSSGRALTTPIAAITSFSIEDGKAKFKGYAFNNELETTTTNIESRVEFTPVASDAQVLSLPVKQEVDETLDIKYYSEYFKSHARGAFSNSLESAADVSILKPGTYTVSINCKHEDSRFKVTEVFRDERVRWIQDMEFLYLVASRNASLIVKKYRLSHLETSATEAFFLSTYRQTDGALRLRGHFAVRGIELLRNPRYFRYRLLLTSTVSGYPELLIPLKARNGSLANEYFSDPFHDYTRSRFVLDAPVNDLKLSAGRYKMSVLLLTEDEMFQYPTNHILEKEKD